jgi:hypothetical protein
MPHAGGSKVNPAKKDGIDSSLKMSKTCFDTISVPVGNQLSKTIAPPSLLSSS